MGLQSITTKQFLALLSAALSLTLLSSGVVTWVAANWQSIAPSHKILLLQGLILLIGLAMVLLRQRAVSHEQGPQPALYWWYQGLAFLGAVVSGALLALVGQIYQTGADTWQLFALWFVLILPWFAFSPNVFIAALAAVVANTAAVLFLLDNQLLISRTTATYLLAFLNALLFLGLEHKWAKHDSLWAVLSTTVLICAITLFASAKMDGFSGAISLHLLIAAVLLMLYVKLSRGGLHIKVLIVATMAASLTAYILEVMADVYRDNSSLAFTLFVIGLIWAGAAFVILLLWRSHSKSTSGLERELTVKSQQQPAPISVFLALSSLLVAVFFYMAFYLIVEQSYGNQLAHFTSELAIILLLLVLVILYFCKGGVFAYSSLVLYELAVFMGIERYISHHYLWSYDGQTASIPWGAYITPLLALVVSVLIYRRRSESWIRFTVSLGFFVFLSILPKHSLLPWLTSEIVLLPLVFIALIWWFFRKAETVQMPLFAAFMLWALYVVVSTFYKNYYGLYMDSGQEITFSSILLTFLLPIKVINRSFDLSMNLLIANSIYWFLIVVVSLVPLWALWQISKDKGTTAKLVALLMGLLVFWLWFGRVEIIITFSLMVLAYYYKSRMLYYSAVVLGLIGLSMFYFSLSVPLTQKVYLLLLSGSLFLVLYFVFVKKLLIENKEVSHDFEAHSSKFSEVAESFKTRVAPFSRAGFYGLLFLAVSLPLAASQWQVLSFGRILGGGQSVLLRLQPVDPRSLMQGDYMVINYELGSRIQQVLGTAIIDEAAKVQISDSLKKRLSLEDGVRFLAEVRVIDGVAEQPLGFYESHEISDFHSREDVVFLPFVLRSEYSRHVVIPSFSTEFFFNEEAARAYEQARFAELIVADGRALLRALLDIDRIKISTATSE